MASRLRTHKEALTFADKMMRIIIVSLSRGKRIVIAELIAQIRQCDAADRFIVKQGQIKPAVRRSILRSLSSSGAEAESEPWGRARRSSSSSGAEAESEPWGRARRSFLCHPRLDLVVVDLTLASDAAVGAGQATLFCCQVGQWSGEVTAITSALSTEGRASG